MIKKIIAIILSLFGRTAEADKKTTEVDLTKIKKNIHLVSVKDTDLKKISKKYLGLPYVWGGNTTKDGGFDCSGLVLQILRDTLKEDIPDMTASRMSDYLEKFLKYKKSQAPFKEDDILFYKNKKNKIYHVAIALNEKLMIEAPKRGEKIRITKLRKPSLSLRHI